MFVNSANQLRLSSKLQNTVGNLQPYGGFETGNNWVANATTIQVGTTDEKAHTGSHSLKLEVSAVSGLNSAHTDLFQVQPGETITYSAYVLVPQHTGRLMLSSKTATSAATYISGPTAQASDQWQRLQMSYTNDADEVVFMRTYFCTREIGSYYIDSVQVEKSPTASRYNLVENGDFRLDSGWEPSGTDAPGLRITVDKAAAPQLENTVYQITGNRTKSKTLSQTLQISGDEGDCFVLAGWAKGYSAPAVDYDAYTRRFAVRARFKYTDNSNSDYFYATFNPSTRQWQYASAAMVAKKDYKSITVEIVYHNNVNVIYFDGIQLYKEEFGSSYTYADKEDGGEVISVVDAQKKRTEYKYDKNGNLTEILEDNNAKVTYEYYEGTHNVKTATTEEGLVYSFEYDQWGNNTKVTIGSGETTISSTAKYTDDGNFQISSTDALGKTTFYGYNVDTGMLEWVQYPEDSDGSDGELDTRTKYTYDSMYRQAAAVCQISEDQTLSASYEYTDDYLTTIRTPTTTYNFEYGVFGLRKSVKVGSQELAGYTYNQDWYLRQLTYGNGDFVQYEYDKKGRLETQTYEDGDKVSYTYNNDGDLATVTDETTGITTTYYYDLLGRQMKYVEKGDGFTHSVGYEYDKDNNLEELVENINGTERTTSYEYDDDNRVTSVTTDGTTVEYTYDDYGRISQQVTKNGNTTILTESFTNTGDTDAKTTSSQIKTYTTVTGSKTICYTYTYDDNGNILSISDSGTNSTPSYVYDKANQLIRENIPQDGVTYVWTYDDAGNIRTRSEYEYTTEEDLTGFDFYGTVTYTYGDTNWGDLLTRYGTETVTYDEIGNPETFGDRTYTWEHGRQLKSLTEDSITWNYTYDASGMRTSRSNGIVTYQYVYNGSQLTQMTVDQNGDDTVDDTLTFTYDATGSPLTVTVNNTRYYYVLNAQGDITRLCNADGSTALVYEYSAWGNMMYHYGDTQLYQLNPLCYRGYVYDRETGLYYLQSRYYDPMIGRFVNADAFAATGQGFTGNNMFAYCGNNPVLYSDNSGMRHEISAGGVGFFSSGSSDGSSDGQMDSDKLLQYLIEQSAENADSSYYFTVEYVGIYTHKTDYTLDGIMLGVGVVSFIISLIPAVREVALVTVGLNAISVADIAISGADFIGKVSGPLSDKDYHQYHVTLQFIEEVQFNGETFRTLYTVDAYYLWDDRSITNPSWYLQKAVQTTFPLD